jgi:hypothetical protein
MLFHGNTMNFYVGAPRFLPPVLTRLGLACLAFNRRGHDILTIRDSRAAEGAAFQLTKTREATLAPMLTCGCGNGVLRPAGTFRLTTRRRY